MQGQSECLTSNTPVLHAYEYKWLEDRILPLINPVGEDVKRDHTKGYVFMEELDPHLWLEEHVLGSACYGHTNLVPRFCEAYIEITGREVLAVHAAKGSTVIADWLPGSEGYEALVKKAVAGIRKASEHHEIEHIFFIWLQGESDAIQGNSKAYYMEKIQELKDGLKKDLEILKFGIIRVGRFTGDHRDLEIISAQDEVCIQSEDFLMLSSISTDLNMEPIYMNPFVNGHYSAKGLEKLGEDAGKKLGSYLS